jgi:hypothetical protein
LASPLTEKSRDSRHSPAVPRGKTRDSRDDSRHSRDSLGGSLETQRENRQKHLKKQKKT